MNPKSMTMIKLMIILLILNIAFLNQSQASNKGSTTTLHKRLPKTQPPSNSDSEYDYEYEQFIEQCEKRMTPECAEQIIGHILEDKSVKDKSVNKICCATLVNMGPDCHKELFNRERSSPGRKKKIKKQMEKAEKLWEKCEIVAGPGIEGNDYPKLPKGHHPRPNNEQFLRRCAKKLTKKCGHEIVETLFGGEMKVDQKCCSRLMQMGDDCHEEMVKQLLALARDGHYKVDEKEVEMRSDILWKHCQKIIK